jgi:Lrp/AsnC family transcriptional regulator, regulator for asnA, asnC and gidA
MDERDLEILEFLRQDGRIPFTEIAKELGVTEGTIRNRVAKLQENRILQIIGMADPHQLGYDAPAIIGLSVQPPHLEKVAEAIAALPEVSYLILVSGEYDLMVEVMCRDRQTLATFLREKLQQIEGVQRTETFMILHTYKMALGAQPMPANSKVGLIAGEVDG